MKKPKPDLKRRKNEPATKICSNKECPREQPLPIEQFAIRADSGKRRGQCRDCVADRRSKHWHNNKERLSRWQKEHYEENKEEILSKNREYWHKTKDDRHKQQKEYHQSEQGKLTSALWKEKNRTKIRKQKSANHKKKLKTDPTYRLRHYVAGTIREVLKGKKGGKATWEHLPYTPLELKEHIENLFEPWMTWDNHGKYNPKTWDDNDQSTWTWQLDHIEPQSKFPYKSMKSKLFKECWALSNLRPLSAKQNIIDGGRQTRHRKGKKIMKPFATLLADITTNLNPTLGELRIKLRKTSNNSSPQWIMSGDMDISMPIGSRHHPHDHYETSEKGTGVCNDHEMSSLLWQVFKDIKTHVDQMIQSSDRDDSTFTTSDVRALQKIQTIFSRISSE